MTADELHALIDAIPSKHREQTDIYLVKVDNNGVERWRRVTSAEVDDDGDLILR